MNTELTELVFILDRSGSMSGLESDTIGGFNSMIARQKEQKIPFQILLVVCWHMFSNGAVLPRASF